MPLKSEKLRRWSRKLKEDFPLGFPVKIRTKDSLMRGGVHGYAVMKNGVGWIYLERLDESVMVDYLFHEWAHLYCPEVEGEHDDEEHHGDAFWLTLGEMHRKYETKD
jgi:hypothetical protein